MHQKIHLVPGDSANEDEQEVRQAGRLPSARSTSCTVQGRGVGAPVGLAINCTEHFPGSEADADIFHKNLDLHETNLHKFPFDEELLAGDDDGALADAFSVSEWAVLADKSYEALVGEAVRAVHPLREPPGGRVLTRAEAKQNCEIASNRAIVDKFLGRLYTLWTMCSDRYRWSSKHYGTIFRACLTLMNVASMELSEPEL